MNRGQVNLQDTFLNQARKENIGVTIYLVNGVQLRGIVRGFDAFTVLLDTPGKATQLVYKHSITSIVPARNIPNMHGEEACPEQHNARSNGALPVQASDEPEAITEPASA
jgi:host factor-I protein